MVRGAGPPRHIVTNTQLPEWFERAEGQHVVQTWHGTPLKRIGRDLAGSPAADPHYIAALPHRSAQWSLLVSPNRFSTPILRHAFGYTGPVLESGYPRNDLLDAHGRAERAARVRRRLAIPEDRTVVLYAPTWREDRPKRGGRYALDLPSTRPGPPPNSATATSCWSAATTWSAARSPAATTSATSAGTRTSPNSSSSATSWSPTTPR